MPEYRKIEIKTGITGSSIKILVVNDDAEADGGKVEAVSKAVRGGLPIDIHAIRSR